MTTLVAPPPMPVPLANQSPYLNIKSKAPAMPAMPGFTFGCDPELFIVDREGTFVSADEYIPGSKENPHPVPYGAIQKDGVAAEFNIEPAGDFDTFNRHMKKVMQYMKEFIPRGYKFVSKASAEFSENIWKNIPDESKELGCTPDFNAWTGEVNPPPDGEAIPRVRTGSGHLHIGWTNDADMNDIQHIMNCRDLVKQFDWYLGAWSLEKDTDKVRRKLYGRAGAMRYKPYGVEYRVLSNFWVQDEQLRIEVWNRMQTALRKMRDGFLPGDTKDGGAGFQFNELLIRGINDSDLNPYVRELFKFPISKLYYVR